MARLAVGQLFRASIVAVGVLLLVACPARAGVLDATWNAPTTGPGGGPLTNLASYRVYYGTSASPCPTSSFLAVPSVTSTPEPGTVVTVPLTGLIAGTVYVVQVTALDENGNESACSSPASGVARPAPLAVTITSAAVNLNSSGIKTLTLAGTVSDNEGVTQVSWTNSQGGSGTETGTTNWTTSDIVLKPGQNVLTITATDAAGNGGTVTLTVDYVPPPTITSISPTSVTAVGSAFMLVVAGTNFVDPSLVLINGAPRTTSYVSPTQLTATVLANDITAPGTVQVMVVTSGGTSNTASLTISPPSATSSTTAGGSTTTGSTTTSTGTSTITTTGGSTTSTTVDPSSSMTAVLVTDSATAPGGSTGNSAASDSMFNADGTLFYLHHRDVGTFLYSADRGTRQVTQLGQLPASTPNGDTLAYDGAPWDPTNPNVLYAVVMSTTRRELWQLTLPLPAGMTLLHDFSSEVPTGGYPSSRVQVSSDGRYFVIVASTTGGSGTYDHVTVWDRQTGGSQALQLPSGIGGLMLRSMVFGSSGAYALLETIDSSGRTDVVLLTTATTASTATMTAVRVTDSATASGGSIGNSAASDSMFNADGTLFYLHHRNVGTFLYSADRGTRQVTQLGQLPANTPNGDTLAFDGAPWDPTQPNVLYAIVMSTTRRELWQLTLPLPAGMTLLHDFSNEVATGGYPSSRVQVSSDGRYFVIVASTTGGAGTYDHVTVWNRQTGGSQALRLPSGIGGLMLRSMVFGSGGAYALLETIDSSGRTDVVFLLVPSAPSSTATTPPSVSFSAPFPGATVAGTMTVTASMAGNITRVQYYLDGALVAVHSPPEGSFTWDSATVGDGSHTWKAVVYNAAGNIAQAVVTFTVSNAPPVPVGAPPPPPSPGA